MKLRQLSSTTTPRLQTRRPDEVAFMPVDATGAQLLRTPSDDFLCSVINVVFEWRAQDQSGRMTAGNRLANV
jgi:hypothetical protein